MSLFSALPGGLVGGMLIGLSAGTLLLGNGNVLGASGIARSALQSPLDLFSKTNWKAHFLAGFFVVSEVCARFLLGSDSLLAVDTPGRPVVSTMGFAVAGFLVGLGTKLGNGCTSGHGICGLARRSTRSLAAVMTFMGTGILTASMCSPNCSFAPFLRTTVDSIGDFSPNGTSALVGNLLTGGLVIASAMGAAASCSSYSSSLAPSFSEVLVAWVSGGLFSLGLALSGMVMPEHIFGFLDAKGLSDGTWDPTLVFVMGGGLLVSLASYELVPGYNLMLDSSRQLQAPWSSKDQEEKKNDEQGSSFSVPTSTIIDAKLLAGAGLFGLGWGIGGLCPGPALFHAATGYPGTLYVWWPMFAVGGWVASKV